MTEFAAVSGQATATPGAGAAKSGAKGSGASSPLDGAFATLFGKAAGAKGTADADGQAAALAAQDGKSGKPVMIDPALAQGEPGAVAAPAGEGLKTETGETQATKDEIDPATGKPRKPGSRGKDKASDADATLLQAQAAAASAAPAAGRDARRTPGKADDEDAKAINAAAAATQPEQVAQAVEKTTAKADGKPAADTAKLANAGETAAAAKDQPPANIQASSAGQRGDQQTDGRAGTGTGEGHAREHGKSTLASLADAAANDDAALTASADPLRDIMQSLPPVVQSQLSVGGTASAGGPSVASTSELLGDKVIDMGVSGQWIDRMAREIATLADGTGHSRFQLSPPNLGKIQVDLWHGDDKMNLRLIAETDEAAQRLRDGQGTLATHARIASLALGSVSVEKSAVPFDNSRDQNQRQGDPQQQPNAQAQGQSGQGRGGSGTNTNREGFSAMMGQERRDDSEPVARTTGASDPRVRFA